MLPCVLALQERPNTQGQWHVGSVVKLKCNTLSYTICTETWVLTNLPAFQLPLMLLLLLLPRAPAADYPAELQAVVDVQQVEAWLLALASRSPTAPP
jgi:hypothetical protein